MYVCLSELDKCSFPTDAHSFIVRLFLLLQEDAAIWSEPFLCCGNASSGVSVPDISIVLIQMVHLATSPNYTGNTGHLQDYMVQLELCLPRRKM